MDKFKKLLEELLAENGVSAEFNYNLKHYGMRGVNNVQELMEFMEHKPIEHLIFLAFYWNCDKDKDRGSDYWRRISIEWKKRLLNESK